MTENSVQPACSDEAKGGGKGLLHPGARGKRRGAMLLSETGQSVTDVAKILIEEFEGASELEDDGGIGDVLTGSAPVDVTGGFGLLLGNKFGEHFDEWDGDVAGERGGFCESGEIEVFGAALGGDSARGELRDDRGSSFGPCEAGFEEEHALDGLSIGEDTIERVVAEQRVEKSHRVGVRCVSK